MTLTSTIIATVAIIIAVASFVMSMPPREGELMLAYTCGRHDGTTVAIEGSTILFVLDQCEKYRGLVWTQKMKQQAATNR